MTGDQPQGRSSTMRRVLIGVAIAVAGVIVLVVGGTWVYINLIRDDAPEALSLDTATTGGSPATTSGSAGGEDPGAVPGGGSAVVWTATPESVVGYRVDEILFGQDVTAVGRTNEVTGSLTLEGDTVTATEFEVAMASIESDESRRDGQFRGRIMDVEQFPTSSFVLTEPIPLGAVPTDGEVVTAEATGELTLRGTTMPVTFGVEARVTGDRAEVAGSIPIVFEEWGIPDPSIGPVSTEDNGILEFLLVLAPA